MGSQKKNKVGENELAAVRGKEKGRRRRHHGEKRGGGVCRGVAGRGDREAVV
jgi:hypothetical protein